MPRTRRIAPGGLVYHVLNRANGAATIFETSADHALFERVLALVLGRVPIRVLAYCVMPNHWHLVLWPLADDDLARFVGRLTQIHTQRRHLRCNGVGSGHLYQGRFKAFPLRTDEHFLTVCRYVERNPLRAGLVPRAERWPWSSLGLRHTQPADAERLLSRWPVPRPPDWLEWVNRAETPAELEAARAAGTVPVS